MGFLNVFLRAVFYPIKVLAITLIYLYKLTISGVIGHTCRFYPTCSSYMLIAIHEWGVVRGIWLGIKRIFRCRPKGNTGEDFVPLNVKGELKWTY